MEAFLGLGSNLGDRRAHLAHALRRLAASTTVSGLSSVYETTPVGHLEQGPFLNMVARVEIDRSPDELLELVLEIERERGRERTFRNAPRTLDIDILLYGDRLVDRPGLTIPHPRMHERPFVLIPMLEIDPHIRDPRTGRRFAELLAGRGGGALEQRESAPGVGDAGVRKVVTGEELLGNDADE